MIPEKFAQFLGPYGPVIYDPTADCNCVPVAVGYGHVIIGSLGEALWAELGQYCKQIYDHENRYWVAVTKTLTREEAVLTFGPITAEEYGPRGGWRSVTFGNTRFSSKLMAPASVQNKPKRPRKPAEPASPQVKKTEYTQEQILDAYQKMYGDKK